MKQAVFRHALKRSFGEGHALLGELCAQGLDLAHKGRILLRRNLGGRALAFRRDGGESGEDFGD